MDRLVEIPLSELDALRKMYEKKYPNSEIGFYVLTNYVNWFAQDPDIPGFHAYSLNGDWSDGTFVVLHSTLICGHTLSDDPSRLKAALDLLELDPKSHYRYLYEPFLRPMVWRFIKEKRLSTANEWDFRSYILTPDVGSKLIVPELPKGFVARNIPMEAISDLCDAWSFRYPNSEERVKLCVKYNPSLAVYTEGGELAGWALRYEYGAMAMLHVNESFRKLGLGRYIAAALSKIITDSGEPIYGNIIPQNDVSLRLFKSLGFKPNGIMYFLEILPSEPI